MLLARLPYIKKVAILWVLILVLQVTLPTAALALTSGPSQPEVQSFEPVGTSEMVDLFSGDFNYNIPLLDVGGYPINLAYHAGVGMDEEASWVGLGWNLNPGAINRNMRGLPDEYAGEEIKRELNIKPNISASLIGNLGLELVGVPLGFGVNSGIRYNNYKGLSITSNFSVGLDINRNGAFGMNAGLGLGFDSANGLDVTPNLGLSFNTAKEEGKGYFHGNINIGAPYNSRQGLQELSYSLSAGKKTNLYLNNRLKQQSTVHESQLGVGSSGSLISFNTPSYTTQADYNREQFSFSLNASTGQEFPALQVRVGMTGTFSQATTIGNRNLNAYGYLNHHLARSKSDLLDFNREKDGPYFKSSGMLPLTNLTYDSYNISGQGVGGSYRPYHNALGHVYDAKTISRSASGGGGAEIPFPLIGGAINSFKAGASIMLHSSSGHSGDWVTGNSANSTYEYKNTPNLSSHGTQSLYESTYFKQIGEQSVNNGSYQLLEKDEALALKLTGPTLSNEFLKKDKSLLSGFNLDDIKVQDSRTPRNQPLEFLTGLEAEKSGTFHNVFHYTPGLHLEGNGSLQRTGKMITSHVQSLGASARHPFEMRVIRPDGMRYIYSLPFYNTHKEDVSFNASSSAQIYNDKQLISYNSNDASSENKNGDSHFYNKEVLPPYIYGHGLTAVLSPDYSDRTGDGPSDDDYGSWTKFNYSCFAGPMSPEHDLYNWRFPYPSKGNQDDNEVVANFSEGFKSQKRDDKGNYQFGSKELWHLHSIESRTHTAIFYTSDRQDAKGVDAANGITTNVMAASGPMQRLDSIRYYSKNDLELQGTSAIPLKTVHFNYNYSLCPGIPNSANGLGKLTLESLHFTYGNSLKGEFSRYNFHYEEGGNHDNPNYNRKAQDRWGNFQEEYSAACQTPNEIGNCSGPLSNSDYPYNRQNRDDDEFVADQYANAWNLKRIELPSGGDININYESDDYAFIQNKTAGKMFTLFGTSEFAPQKVLDVDEDGTINTRGKFKNYITLKLDNPLTTEGDAEKREEFHNYYLKNIDQLYFRCLVDLKDGNHEFVPGYASIEEFGVIPDQNEYVWIKLKGVGFDNNNGSVNPIAKAAWQFARLNIPHLVFPGQDRSQGDIKNVITGLMGLVTKDLPRMIGGFNQRLAAEGYGSQLVPGKSYVRLNHPNGAKKGGGCRVSKLSITDHWNAISGNGQDAVYGQQYFYKTMTTLADGSRAMISSGVASYEPVIGGDENPFKTPIQYDENRSLAPDNNYYVEHPMGESLFPSAHVGYSKVIVANLRPSSDIKRTMTGYSMNEFYTTKDFPYKVELNEGKAVMERPSPISQLFKFSSHDFMHASQGYSVILNDMHGRPKSIGQFEGGIPHIDSELVLDDITLENDQPISGMRYFYKQKDGQLDNEVDVVGRDGQIETAFIGVESEMALDFREQENKSVQVDAQLQIDIINIIFGFIPVIIPIPTSFPSYSDNHILFRSSVATKVVNHHGLIDRIQVFNEGSIVETNNLLYDKETGEVLLTSVNNEFRNNNLAVHNTDSDEDLIYNLKYPAHWAYSGMGPAYQNTGAKTVQSVDVDDQGRAYIPDAKDIFEAGDEVFVYYVDENEHNIAFDSINAWVTGVGNFNSGPVTFIRKNGRAIPASNSYGSTAECLFKVIRSGHRNQQSLPIAQMTSLKNPAEQLFVQQSLSTTDPIAQAEALEVLDFSAQEYDQNWQTYCDQEGQMNQECVYSMEILHPVNNNPGIEVIIVPDDQEATINYRCNTTKVCEGDSITVHSELQSELAYGLRKGATMENLPPGHFIDDLFLVEIRYHNHHDNSVIDIPLSPSTAELDGPAGNVAASDLYLDTNDPDKLANAIKIVIINYLLKDFIRDVEFSDPTVEVGEDFIDISSSPKHDPTGNWVGIDNLNKQILYNFNMQTYVAPFNSNGFAWHFNANCSFDSQCGQVSKHVRYAVYNIGGTNYNHISIYPYPTIVNFLEENQICPEPSQSQCGYEAGDTINPFVQGTRGNWRPTKTYVHNNVPRKSSSEADPTAIANDGYYTLFDQFWNKPISSSGFWTADLDDINNDGIDDDYVASASITKYSPYGQALESKDALNIYSAAILGYDKKLAVAAGANTRYREMAFDGFEEYTFYQRPDLCHSNAHLDLLDGAAIDNISDKEVHTGYYSLKVKEQSEHEAIVELDCPSGNEPSQSIPNPYILSDCEDCLPDFSPQYSYDENNTYVFDAWVHDPDSKTEISLEFSAGNFQLTSFLFEAEGPIIDGWQRVYAFFELDSDATEMGIRFINNSSSDIFIDDVRMYPFDANMKSFVYHPSSLKLMAELDENNHATFYEYDEEWNLIRVKKETERGIVTLQENRSNVRIVR